MRICSNEIYWKFELHSIKLDAGKRWGKSQKNLNIWYPELDSYENIGKRSIAYEMRSHISSGNG